MRARLRSRQKVKHAHNATVSGLIHRPCLIPPAEVERLYNLLCASSYESRRALHAVMLNKPTIFTYLSLPAYSHWPYFLAQYWSLREIFNIKLQLAMIIKTDSV